MLFPPLCVSCEKRVENEDVVLCISCIKSIMLHSSFFCPVCEARVPPGEKICHGDAGYILAAATSYEQKAVRNLIHALKYSETREGAMLIAHIIFEYLKRVLPLSLLDFSEYIAIPIPLYKRKERTRGYNQSFLIAEELKKIFEMHGMMFPEIHTDIITRNTNTLSQTECQNIKERKKNISGCFSVSPIKIVEKKNIVLIDDVHTTGATIGEAVRILKQHGAKRIIALVCAKT